MLRSCPSCRRQTGARWPCEHCGYHPAKKGRSWSPGRDRSAQARFRRALVARAGERCEWVDPETGRRCDETEGLQAHHLDPGNDDPRRGALLCREHHKKVDPYAR